MILLYVLSVLLALPQFAYSQPSTSTCDAGFSEIEMRAARNLVSASFPRETVESLRSALAQERERIAKLEREKAHLEGRVKAIEESHFATVSDVAVATNSVRESAVVESQQYTDRVDDELRVTLSKKLKNVDVRLQRHEYDTEILLRTSQAQADTGRARKEQNPYADKRIRYDALQGRLNNHQRTESLASTAQHDDLLRTYATPIRGAGYARTGAVRQPARETEAIREERYKRMDADRKERERVRETRPTRLSQRTSLSGSWRRFGQ
jgi:uncharacterized coiled-coil protein SlyX